MQEMQETRGNGNPLQYSCLNPMDTGAWWATVQRVPKTGLDRTGWLSTHTGKEKKTIIIAYAISSNGIFTEPGTVLSSVSVINISSLALNHLFNICSGINKNSFEYFSFKLNTIFSFLSREHSRIAAEARGLPALCYRNWGQWYRYEFIQQTLFQPQNWSLCDFTTSARRSLSTAPSTGKPWIPIAQVLWKAPIPAEVHTPIACPRHWLLMASLHSQGCLLLALSSSLAKPVNFSITQWAKSHLQWGSEPFPHLSFLPPSALGNHADFPDIIDYSLIIVNTFYINFPSLAYCVISISWMDPDHFKYFTCINSLTFCNNLVHGILLLTLFFRWRKFVRLDNSHSNWGFNFNVKN